jgi:hypothetical protein
MARPIILDQRHRELNDATPLDVRLLDMLGDTTMPSATPTGKLRSFAFSIAGLLLPAKIGADGLINVLAPNALNRASLVATPASGTSLSQVGATLTLSGSVSHPAIGNTSYFSSHLKTRFATSTTAGNVSGWRNNSVGECMIKYGFLHHTRLGLTNIVSGMRFFAGLSNSIGVPSNIDPLADTTIVKVGIGCNLNTGNLFIIHGPSGSTPTTIDLGSDFPVNATDAYDLFLYSPPNGSIEYMVAKISQVDGSWTHITTGTLSTNLPSATTTLLRYGLVTNNATAAVASVDVLQIGIWRL